MQYQDRVKIITGKLNSFLRHYQRPSHMDNETALMEVQAIAEEVNGHISNSSGPDALEGRVADAFKHLRKSYKGRSWPTVSHFVDAMRETVPRETALESPSDDLDAHRIAAKRIKCCEPVGDGWIYGRQACELLEKGMVTIDDLRRYRSALYFKAKRVWGEERARDVERGMIERHEGAA